MNRTKFIICVAFVLAMGAGVAVGMLGSRTLPPHNTLPAGPGRGDPQSWLISELQLTPDQQQKMNQIWSEMLRTKGPQYGEEFRTLQQKREAAIAEIMSEPQQSKYKQVNEDFMQQAKEVWKRMEQDFSAAADRTRQILNDSQRPRYDALIARFRSEHQMPDWFSGMGPMGGPPFGRGPSSRTSAPAMQ